MTPVPLDPDAGRYNRLAIALHWLLALAIVGAFGMGLYMHDLPFSVQRVKLFNWHKWAGITILALSAARLLWRLARPPPPLGARISAAMPPWQHGLHRGVHLGLYLMFFAVPLLGWAYSSAAGVHVVWFGVLPLPDLVAPDKALADEVLKPLHRVAAYLLAALVSLHVAGALKHQFVDRDGLLWRMWPGTR
jgi:cytochrome b561